MVAVPTRQGPIAGVFKQKLQCRRFNMAVAKHHVGLALVTGKYVSKFFKYFIRLRQASRADRTVSAQQSRSVTAAGAPTNPESSDFDMASISLAQTTHACSQSSNRLRRSTR